MSPKTIPNAEKPSVDRLAAFAGRAKVSPAMLDKGQLRQIVEVLYSGRGRARRQPHRQAERLPALFSGRHSWPLERVDASTVTPVEVLTPIPTRDRKIEDK